jgi:hypothetical protein
MRTIAREIGPTRAREGRFKEACALFQRLATGDTLADFLTSAAYSALDDAPVLTINQPETSSNGATVDHS